MKLWRICRVQNDTIICEIETHMRELTIYIVESLEPIITSYLESHLKFLFKIFFLCGPFKKSLGN